MTKTNCTGTEYYSLTEAVALRLLPADWADQMYGRQCCKVCSSFVLTNADGRLRSHKAGANTKSQYVK